MICACSALVLARAGSCRRISFSSAGFVDPSISQWPERIGCLHRAVLPRVTGEDDTATVVSDEVQQSLHLLRANLPGLIHHDDGTPRHSCFVRNSLTV
jgi:hypothetical protein